PAMKRNKKIDSRLTGSIAVLTLAANVLAQTGGLPNEQPSSAGLWPYVLILIILTSVGVAYYYWKKSRESIEQANHERAQNATDYFRGDNYESSDVDADKELEWLRKAKRSSRPQKQKSEPNSEGEELWRGA